MSLVREALRDIPALADLPDDEFDWFASNCAFVQLGPGECYIREGTPAENMAIILEGEIVARTEKAPTDQAAYTARAGAITGALPFSRMVKYPRTGRAIENTRVALFPRKLFPELAIRTPALLARLVHTMLDRARDITVAEQQFEKMLSLGRLSAGLAHELNNPAAAVRRATDSLKESLRTILDANVTLDERQLTSGQRRYLACAERETVRQVESRPELDALTRAGREEQVADWLSARAIPKAWELAPLLVDMNWSDEDLDDIAARFDPADLSCVLARLTATANVGHLSREISAATRRITRLIDTMREYSQMDRMPEREVDVHDGLENTVAIFSHRLNDGVSCAREYDRRLPLIYANPGALNQVWTKLIENALDAMDGRGCLHLHTRREQERALVEVRDTGPGVPADIRHRIFEPFFSTKPPGKGAGLGLDTVFRIVRQHHGTVTFDSHPGSTAFMVRLPFQRFQPL